MRRPLPVLFAASCAVVALVGCDSFRAGLARGREAAVERRLQESAAEMSRKLPMMVDKETRLETVTVLPGKVLQFDYTLTSYQASQLDLAKFTGILQAKLTNVVKTAKELAPLRELGVTFVYTYRDKAGADLGIFRFGPADYKG